MKSVARFCIPGNCFRLSTVTHALLLLVIAAFVTALFWAKARDPFRRIEFSVRTVSGTKVKGMAVLPKTDGGTFNVQHSTFNTQGTRGKAGSGNKSGLPVVIYLHGSGGNLLTDGKNLRLIAEQGVAAVGLEYNQTNQGAFDEEFVALHEFLARQKWAGGEKWKSETQRGGTFNIQHSTPNIQGESVLSAIRHLPSADGICWIGFSLGAQRQLSFLLRHPEYEPNLVIRISGGVVDEVSSLKFPPSSAFGASGQVSSPPAAGGTQTEGNEENKDQSPLSLFPSVKNAQLPSSSAFLLVHGENDEVFPANDCRRLEDFLKAQGMAVEMRIFPGQNHSFGSDRPVVMRGVAEYCATLLGGGPETQNAKLETLLRPLRLNMRPLYLHYWIPFGLMVGFVAVRGYLRWRKSVAQIPRGRFGTVILWLAWILGIAAFVDTTVHLGLPRLQATESRLNLARRWLVQPKQTNDFDWLVKHLQEETKGTENSALKDYRIGTLLEHLELADYNRGLVNWQVEDDIYREFILSPIIESAQALSMSSNMAERTPHPGPLPIGSADSADAEREERFSRQDVRLHPSLEINWRRPLWENFYPRIRKESDPLAAAQIVVRFLRERVTIVPGEMPYPGVRAIWESELTDAAGFERIYVAALRSAGIPARLDGQRQAEIFADGKWLVAPRPLLGVFLPEEPAR